MKKKIVMGLVLAGGVLVCLSTAAQAELRCHQELDGQRCEQVSDGKGHTTTKCWPKTKTVCVEVSPPPQTVRPAGGVVKGGAWGGATIPIK